MDQSKDRVRESSSKKANRKIDDLMINNIDYYLKNPDKIDHRIKELGKKWSIERVLELNMSVLSLTGIALAVFVNIYWLILPSVVLLFFVQHAIQGWCPPLPLFRALKVRTRSELDQEKYALKLIRGDFKHLNQAQLLTPDSVFEAMKN